MPDGFGFQLPVSQQNQMRQQMINQLISGNQQRFDPGQAGSGIASAISSIGGALLQRQMGKEQAARQQAFTGEIGDISSRLSGLPAGQAGPPQDLANILANTQNIDVRNLLGPMLLKQQLTPQEPQPGFTLSPGQQRFTAGGAPIASVGPEARGGGLGTVSPADFTLESLAKYQQTGNVQDLRRVSGVGVGDVGKVDPAKYTSESLDKFRRTGAFGDLVPKKTVEEMKMEAGKAKEARAESAAIQKADRVVSTIDDALKQIGPLTAGLGGAALGGIPGTAAKDLRSTIDTIQANIGFDTLQEMRANSPTGGALGAVSERELSLLTSTIRSLDPQQSPERLARNLQAVRTHYNNWKATTQGMNPDMDTSQFAQPGTLPRSGQQGRQAIPQLPQGARQIGTSGGKRVFETPDGKRFMED